MQQIDGVLWWSRTRLQISFIVKHKTQNSYSNRLTKTEKVPVNFTLLYFLCRSSFLRITCCFIHSVFSLCSTHKGNSILSQECSNETTKQIWTCLCVDICDKKQMWAHLWRILRLVDTSEGWRPWSLVWSLRILKKLELMPSPRSWSLESWQKQNENFSVAVGTFKLDKMAEEKLTHVQKNWIKSSDQLRMQNPSTNANNKAKTK